MEWSILAIVTALVGIGLLTLYSLSLAQDRGGMFTRQLAGMLAGVAVFLVVLSTDYRRLKRHSKLLYFSTILLLLCTINGGTVVNSAFHLDLGFTLLNVSVPSSFLLIVAIAGIFTDWNWSKRHTLFIRMLQAVKRVKDQYGALLMSGLMALLFIPYFWSIFIAVGLLPPLSVNLPFISYGTTPVIQQMALVGLLLSIYRRKDLQPCTDK